MTGLENITKIQLSDKQIKKILESRSFIRYFNSDSKIEYLDTDNIIKKVNAHYEKQLVADIIDIYNGKYKTYQNYREHCFEENYNHQQDSFLLFTNTLYVLKEEIFYYIKEVKENGKIEVENGEKLY